MTTPAYAASVPTSRPAPTRVLPPKVVRLREAIPTPHELLPKGAAVAATAVPHGLGWQWRLHLTDPTGAAYTVDVSDPTAIRGGDPVFRNAIRRAVAFEEYGFARDVLGYGSHRAFDFVVEHCDVDPIKLRDWGFHQLDAQPADIAALAA